MIDDCKYPPFGYPAVSVIVPLYNAEKYIAECLESLLAQTFTNFEVIVVDDCSTDSSCAIVENYAEKFGGRLTFLHTDKNSGGCALPRNKGLEFSRGEYIFFLDADDLLMPNALEELYTLAKKFDADVVHCERYFEADDALGEVIVKSEEPEKFFVDEPTLETGDFIELLQAFAEQKYWGPAWCKLVHRNLLVENGIKFPPVSISEDDIWTYVLIFYAKRILRVPNAICIHRLSKISVSRVDKTPQQLINFWLNPILFGLQTLEKQLAGHEFFRQNPQYLYQMLEMFIIMKLPLILASTFNVPSFAVYEEIRQEFGDKLGEHDVLIPALCTAMNTLCRINEDNVQNFNEFAEQAQNRIAQLEAELQRLQS